jgi:trimeric autotransporter adhesin
MRIYKETEMLRFVWLVLAGALAGWAGGAAYTIDTVAGTDYVGDGGLATAAQLGGVEGVFVDAQGNLYIADPLDNRVRKVAASGVITTVAGDGHAGILGDGGQAAQAQLMAPYGVVVDASGNIYIAENGSGGASRTSRVRKITTDGVIRTVAGGGENSASTSGDATAAQLNGVRNVALDAGGNLYISCFTGHRVYKIDPSGNLSVVAGTGVAGYSSTATNPLTAPLNLPAGLAIGPNGALYIADSGNHSIRRVYQGAMVTLLQGGAYPAAAAATLNWPTGVAVDGAGNLYIADSGNQRVLKRTAEGVVTTLASVTTTPAAGSYPLSTVRDVSVDAQGNLYIADGQWVAKMIAGGALVTVAGNGAYHFQSNGTAATMNRLYGPFGVGVDTAGAFYIADQGNRQVRKVTKDGAITTVAGPGESTAWGDGGLAVNAYLSGPSGVTVDGSKNLWIADYDGPSVRKVTTAGIISTAVESGLSQPVAVAADAQGNLYIADAGNHQIWRLDLSGSVSVLAGTGTKGYAGDAGTATQARLDTPKGVAVDADGNVYVADQGNHCIRKIIRSTPPLIYTVAGTRVQGFSGDGGLATAAQLDSPTGVAVDGSGTLYIADTYNHRIRAVSGDGLIRTIAGTGQAGFSGDGGVALKATLNTPTSVAVDADGNVYVADLENNRVRKLAPNSGTGPAVVHGASMLAGPIAAGEIVSIFGTNLGPSQAVQGAVEPSGLMSETLSGVQVLFDGVPGTLFYVQANQINVQAPYEIAGQNSTEIEVVWKNVTRAQLTAAVAATAPALFTIGNGTGQVLAINEDNTLNSVANPAARGSVVVLYATGEGQTDPAGVTGKPTTTPYPAPVSAVSVTIGGNPAEILFAGEAPGFVGLMQINARVPSGYAGAGILAVTLRVGVAGSPSGVTLAVR